VNAFLRTREAEKEWHRGEGEYKAVFENALNGIFLISRDLAFVKANPAMCRLLQQPHDKIVGRPILDFVPHDRRAEAVEIFKRLEQDGAWRGVFALERADGHAVHLESNLSEYSVSDIWLAVVSDISGRLEIEREREELLVSERAARTEAERANRLKDDFLATLSHELRTPLNAIVGWSQLLKIGGLDEKESAEGIEAIERNAKIQAQMIADLLDVSRITSGKLRLDLQPIDPAATVEAAVGAVLPAAGVKEIEVIKIFDRDVGLVSGDAGRLQQVVWNLTNNAVKFTPKGGKIEIRLQRNDSQAVLSVTDNGQGIGPDVLPYIFDRFRQGDATSTRGQSGLGLGLAIAKQLVEMHGGTIRAESPGEGKGATFVVSLPLAPVRKGTDLPAVRPGPRLRAGAGTIDAPVQLEGIRVLVVDDDADSRRLTKRVLADYGAQLMDAENVTQALQVIDDFNPHVLISDLGMPTEDGFDLIRRVRARGYTFHDLPAVALTAFARMEDRRRALLAGFQVHLTKPVDATELSAVIATLVGRTGRDS
jgi:hypothetical protein